MAATGISSALLFFFQKNPNRSVTIDELVEAFPSYERHALMNNVRNLRTTEAGKAIRSVKSGVWELVTGNGSVNAVTFTVLKETEDTYILEDEAGNLYKAVLIG
jgi:hypothetical protein